MTSRIARRLGPAVAAAALAAGAIVVAGRADAAGGVDWPGLWGGSARVAAAPGTGFGPGATLQVKEVWRRPLGSGYSGVSVVEGRGYTASSDGTDDLAVAFEATTGKELWRARLDATYRGHDGSHDGPISTPTVEGGRVFLVSPRGTLFALDAASGKELWRHDLKAEHGAGDPVYGFAVSPLVVGKLVVVQAGGDKGKNLVAYDTATGALAWTADHPGPSETYASPVVATLAGVPQIVVLTPGKVFGARAEDGALLWSHAVQGDASRSPLVLPGDRVFVGQWNEGLLLAVKREGETWTVAERWKTPRLKSTYSPTVYHDGHLYGLNGAFLTCLDPETGEPKWRERVATGSLILVGSHLVVLGERSGHLSIVEATPAGFRELAKARVFTPGAPSHTGPSFAGGRLYLRNVEELVALEITAG